MKKKEDIKDAEHRVRTQWPFIRISEADFKLLKKIERMRKAQPKQPIAEDALL